MNYIRGVDLIWFSKDHSSDIIIIYVSSSLQAKFIGNGYSVLFY